MAPKEIRMNGSLSRGSINLLFYPSLADTLPFSGKL